MFHWSRPYNCWLVSKSRGQISRKTGRKKSGSVSPPLQEIMHPSLSGSRHQLDFFYRIRCEATRTTSKPLQTSCIKPQRTLVTTRRTGEMYRLSTTRLAVGIAILVLVKFLWKRGSRVDQSPNLKLGQNKIFGSHHVTKLQ